MQIERARTLIRQLSDLPANEIRFLGEGTDSAAFRVDRHWVVRFPLVPDTQRTLTTELSLLPVLAPTLPVAIPRPSVVGMLDAVTVFSAYPALEGDPLSGAALARLPGPARAVALDGVEAVLAAVHNFPIGTARDAGVSFEMYKGAYHPAQDEMVESVASLLDPTERDVIAEQRREYLESDLPAPVLLHSDIKPEHLLHDPVSGRITGLLDWGDASLGDPLFDLAIIGMFCGTSLRNELLNRLNRAERERARTAIPFLLTVRGIQDAVWTMQHEDNPDRALRKLRECLLADGARSPE